MSKYDEAKVKELLAVLLSEGVSLSDAQTKINSEFGTSLTYMDIRIIASTLDVDWKKSDPHPAQEEKNEQENGTDEAETVSENGKESGNTVVEISKLVRPGMALSGSVKFASGSTADWYIDQMGRLGLENLVGDRPTPEDIQMFQAELEKAVSGGR